MTIISDQVFLDLVGIDSLLGTRGVSCRCNYSCDSVMYGRAKRTSITVVSKFPRKNLGSHTCATVDTRCSSLTFFERLGMKLKRNQARSGS